MPEKTSFNKDFDLMLQAVLQQAKAAGLPVSDAIDRHVLINQRAKKRYGICICRNGRFTIELSAIMLTAPEKSCLQTLAHEILHTCPGCQNHGTLFRRYADIMNQRYGYQIRCTNSYEEMGITPEPPASQPRYLLECRKCGRQFARIRYSTVIAHPSRYRCNCGGQLKRIQ